MKNRGKSVKTEQEKTKFFSNSNNFLSSSSNIPCKKHPLNSSTVGICAYCLNEKLIKLVCSDCGEQRISSCSCSVFSSYRNSSCTVDIGSVERISNLIEIERGSDRDNPKTLFSYLKMKQSETEETGDVGLLKRSNSCVVEVKKTIGFWKIGKLFRKKRDKQGSSERNRVGFDQNCDVSRSRSLSSFMGDKFHNEICSAKILDFNESERRRSGFKGGLMDFESGFVVKEMDFGRIDDNYDDDEFIDLKFDLCDKSKTEHSVFKKHDQFNSIGSSRIMVNDRGIKKVNNSHMQSWKWMFKNQSENNDLNHILKS
ncbi:hypothetical protein QVD17_31970 [Tagetes erecta]|uniref:Uncharacterized protein n=1 Tax=Tagetes erecta TaxID=13708 RepID=A0AAD8K771_TARER|nr:hypothetical protein QVD17_31970 [Tagetes erecta]